MSLAHIESACFKRDKTEMKIAIAKKPGDTTSTKGTNNSDNKGKQMPKVANRTD